MFSACSTFYAKLECLPSVLGWCEEFTLHHLWWYTKSLSDHMCTATEIFGLCQLLLVYSHQSTVWVSISHTSLYNPWWQERIVVWPCGKLWCVCLPVDLRFHKLWTFGHSENCKHSMFRFQLNCHLIDTLFHHCECSLAFPCGISIPTNVRGIQTSHLHLTHLVCVWSTQKDSLPWENTLQCVLRIRQTHT